MQYIAMFNLLKCTLSIIEFCFVGRLKLEIYASKSIKGVRNQDQEAVG